MDVILFDLDGVLLEGPSLRAATGRPVEEIATTHALATLDIPIPGDGFLAATGRGSYEAMVQATEQYGLDCDPAELWPIRERHLSALEREAIWKGERTVYPDASALEGLANDGLALGIVSNARGRTVEFVVEHFGWEERIAATRAQTFDPDDWYRRKPAPDYLLDALDALGASDGLYVGDGQSDVIAADRAGLRSAFVRREHNEEYELDIVPTYEITSLRELGAIA